MEHCKHCGKDVPAKRTDDSRLACVLCGRILENFYFTEEVTFVKNAAGQSQASGNMVRSVQSGMSVSQERRLRIARDELMNLKDALGIGDEQDAVVVAAANYFRMALDQGFTKGRRSDLVLSSFLYLSCRQLKIPFLLIEFSSYLRVSVYELGYVYLKLCRKLGLAEEGKYEALVDPSIFIVRFADMLLKGAHNDKQIKREVVKTATYIIASMKRDWMQTGRKPSGICGAALYTAALSHGIKCSKTDIVKIVHICEATLTKRLIEFGNTEAASFTVDELSRTEKERAKEMEWRKRKPNPDKEGNVEEEKEVVLCKHKDCKPVDYGLCASCYSEFIRISGGLEGGSDPPAFQRAEKQRAAEKASREENEEQVNSERDPYYSSVNKRCLEKGEGENDKDGNSDESSTLSDVDDREVDCYFRNAEEARDFEIMWDLLNPEYNEKEAAKKAAAEEAARNNCPGDARNLFEASKAAAAKARKEKRRKRAEEEKNAPPPATAMEAVGRMVERKKFSGLNLEALEELLGTCPADKKSRTETETVIEKKKEEHEIVEDEQDEEEEEAPYEMNTDENFYEDQVEEEEDGYDFGLY